MNSPTPDVRPFVGSYPDRLTVYQVLGRARRDVENLGGEISADLEVMFPSTVPAKLAATLTGRFALALLDKLNAEKNFGRLN